MLSHPLRSGPHYYFLKAQKPFITSFSSIFHVTSHSCNIQYLKIVSTPLISLFEKFPPSSMAYENQTLEMFIMVIEVMFVRVEGEPNIHVEHYFEINWKAWG